MTCGTHAERIWWEVGARREEDRALSDRAFPIPEGVAPLDRAKGR